MMKIIILLCLNLISITTYGQLGYFYFQKQENSAVTTAKIENAKINLQKAYDTYKEGNLEKTRYYLDQSERDGMASAGFYYLLGKWCYDMKKFTAAKRYWMRGFNKRGCWECKELAEKMKEGEPIVITNP